MNANATETLDRVLKGVVESGGLAGVSATVADRNGTRYEGAFGVRDVATGAAMTPDTVVWIASMTKAITGTAAMQLVEQGALDLDAPASDVVPAIGTVQVLDGFGDDGQPRLRPPASAITLRQLLTHSAGFGYDLWSPELGRYEEITGIPGVLACVDAALQSPLLFDPGTAWMYGINIDWAGKMVEAASGHSLGDHMSSNIFEPLGMTSTAFRISEDMRARLASIHVRDEAGVLTPFPFELPQEPEFQMGGGGLYSTIGDYLRFTQAILRGGALDGNRILSAETVKTMGQNHLGALDVQPLRTAAPPFTQDADFFPGMQQKWGLSFLINTEESPQGRSANSLAWAGLANSYYWIDPGRGTCGVWATQLLPFADDIAIGNFRDFETAVNA